MLKRIKIIIGSVRPKRKGEAIARWLLKKSEESFNDTLFEIWDLKEINLPFLDEPFAPGSKAGYFNQHTKKWSNMVREADAFIFLSPEYNAGYSPALKNAIDYLYTEWKNKPAAIVGYGGGSGNKNSIKQLNEVLNRIGFNVINYDVQISRVNNAIDSNGNINKEYIKGDISILIDKILKTL